MSETVDQLRTGGLQRVVRLTAVVGAGAVYEINMTNATVVLPHLQGSFSATYDQVSWVVTAFIVGMTMGFAAAGWCSDRFGRKQFFIFCLAGYTIASGFCGASTTLYEEIAWRFLQGFIGAPMMPITQAICLDSFPRRQHGLANAIWGFGIMVGPTAGPVVGGYIAEFYHWSWVFYFNIPTGIAAILACWIVLPADPRNPGRYFDWLGFATLIIGAGALQLVLNRGERLAWFDSLEITLGVAATVVCFYVFIVHSLTTPRPFLQLALFRDRNVAAGMILSLIWGFMMHGVLVLLSILMQELRGYPVMTLGTVLAPRGLGVMLGSMSAAWVVRYVDPRYMMTFGMLCMSASAWFMSQWTLDVSAWDVAWTGALQGFSAGFGFIPLTVKAFSTLDRRQRTEGITFLNLIVFTGIGCGIAFAVNIATRSTTILHASLAETVTPFNKLFQFFSMPEAWDPSSVAGLAALEIEIMRQATMISYLNYFYFMAILTLAAIPLVFMFRSGKVTAETLIHDD